MSGHQFIALVSIVGSVGFAAALELVHRRYKTRWYIVTSLVMVVLMTVWAARTNNFPATFGPFSFMLVGLTLRRQPRSNGPSTGQ